MSPIFSFRFDQRSQHGVRDIFVVFLASRNFDADAFATVIEQEIESNLIPDDVVIVVREPSFERSKSALGNESLNKATIARLRGRASVSLVGYGRSGERVSEEHIDGAKPVAKIKFSDFKRRAISSIFKSRQGFVESTNIYHFENPSGRHTEKFIRLSNILARGAEIAFIGFCLLPLLPSNVAVAYIDTPALYAVIAAINEQLSSFAGDYEPILADNFSSYGGLSHYRFERQNEAVTLISASSSGSLAAKLIASYGFERDRVVHLLILGSDASGCGSVCDLGYDAKHNPEGVRERPLVEHAASCSMCTSGSVPIKLQGDQFDIAGPQSTSLLVKKADAPPGLSDVMGRLAGSNVFSVGLGASSGKGCHSFNVDSAALLADDAFSTRLDYLLRRSVSAAVSHVVVLDGESDRLALKVIEFLKLRGKSPVVVHSKDISLLKGDIESICIVASVVESGRSLLDISRDLRSVSPGLPLIYLVGLSKSTGEDNRESLERTLVQTHEPMPHQFIAVERIILPPSLGSWAWADELKLLIDPLVSRKVPAGLSSFYHSRVALLRDLVTPLRDNLFIENDEERKLSLQPGFVFWPSRRSKDGYSLADVYFTISSVLQQLRANASRGGKLSSIKSNWFQQTILAPGNFGRFNDDSIQASLLRAAYPYEMNYTESRPESVEMSRLICRVVSSAMTNRGGAACEFLLALATRRLRLHKADLDDLLQVDDSQLPRVRFLQEICRSRLNT